MEWAIGGFLIGLLIGLSVSFFVILHFASRKNDES